MQRTAWVATGVLWLVAAAFAAAWVARPTATARGPLEALGAADRWTTVWPEKDCFRDLPERFDLSVKVKDSPVGAGSTVRLLVNASDPRPDGTVDRAACVDVSAAGVAIGRVEGGLVLPLAAAGVAIPRGEEHDVTVRRRGTDIAVTVDGRFVLSVLEPYLHGGRVGILRSGPAEVDVWPVRELAEFPELSDDFMRTPDEPGPWTAHSGEWDIETLLTPSMSANGFSYRGRAEDGAALASAGYPTWDDYRAEVSVLGEEGEAMGLVFAFAGPDRYCLFRWRSEGAGDGAAARELVVVEPGPGGGTSERVIASSKGGYRPGQWYRVAVELGFGRVRVLIDEHEALRAEGSEFVSGAVALWSAGAKGAVFDDVLVTPCRAVEERFARAAPEPPAAAAADPDPGSPAALERWRARWQGIGGDWRTGPAGIAAGGAGEAKLVTGSPDWRRASIETEAVVEGGAEGGACCGLVINYRDEGDYVAFRVGGGKARLVRVRHGAAAVMHEADAPGGPARRLRLESDRGYLAGYLDGRLVAEGYDERSVRGRAGLWSSGDGVAFRNFRAGSLPHERPVPLVNTVFEVDNIMGRWAGESADWYRGVESNSDHKVFWHRAPFRGDVELAIDLPEAQSPGAGARLALGVAKSGDQPGNGYAWTLEAAGAESVPAGPGWHCRFVREGVEVADVPLDSGHSVESLFIRRRGRYVLAGANGETLNEYRDDEPLEGMRVAFLAKGLDVDPSSARLYGGLVHDYRFTRAPVEWRVGEGVWRIANRWECDKRWSFLVGFPVDWPSPEARTKVVAIWNKRSFPGDVVVDFFIGPKMADPKLGKKYQRYGYVRDFNLTISADGEDLSSGYSFIFGGFGDDGNEKSAILRGGKILAEDASVNARYPRNNMVGHQRWYRIRAERTGNKLTYRAYFEGHERVLLEAEDPDPLEGDRIAIWSYDCPIVVARVRIAGSRGGAVEEAAPGRSGVTRTPYDVEVEDDPFGKDVTR